MRGSHQKPRGFSLIELMVVAAVLAIAASIAIPRYVEHVRSEQEETSPLPNPPPTGEGMNQGSQSNDSPR